MEIALYILLIVILLIVAIYAYTNSKKLNAVYEYVVAAKVKDKHYDQKFDSIDKKIQFIENDLNTHLQFHPNK